MDRMKNTATQTVGGVRCMATLFHLAASAAIFLVSTACNSADLVHDSDDSKHIELESSLLRIARGQTIDTEPAKRLVQTTRDRWQQKIITAPAFAREHRAPQPRGVFVELADGAEDDDFEQQADELSVHVLNLDAAPYAVMARVVGDAGTMSSRTISEPIELVVGPTSVEQVQVSVSKAQLRGQDHSGMLAVQILSCATRAAEPGRCKVATSNPRFFHVDRADGALRFYNSRVLHKRYGAGAFSADVHDIEPGTTRVMGGGPIHDAIADEDTEL